MCTRGQYQAVLKVCCLQCGTKDEVDIFLHEVNDQSERYALISAGWYQNIAEEIICPECWGLASLSEQERDAVGKALAGFSGFEDDLYLDSLTTLSETAAIGFANIQGVLSLNGLTALSDAAAEALAKHQGALLLAGLTALSDVAAEALAEHRGYLYLSGLTTLSDSASHLALARRLVQEARDEGEDLDLPGLTTLSDAVVELLANSEGFTNGLNLDGLTTLSDVAAEALAEHKGHLYLNGLTTLSDAAAGALAKHGSLNVSGPIQPLIDKFRERA